VLKLNQQAICLMLPRSKARELSLFLVRLHVKDAPTDYGRTKWQIE
jgi:hypothetical protein